MKLFEVEIFNIKRDFKPDGSYELTLSEPEVQKLVLNFNSIIAYKEVEVNIGELSLNLLEIETKNGYYEFIDFPIENMNKLAKKYTGEFVFKTKDVL